MSYLILLLISIFHGFIFMYGISVGQTASFIEKGTGKRLIVEIVSVLLIAAALFSQAIWAVILLT